MYEKKWGVFFPEKNFIPWKPYTKEEEVNNMSLKEKSTTPRTPIQKKKEKKK